MPISVMHQPNLFEYGHGLGHASEQAESFAREKAYQEFVAQLKQQQVQNQLAARPQQGILSSLAGLGVNPLGRMFGGGGGGGGMGGGFSGGGGGGGFALPSYAPQINPVIQSYAAPRVSLPSGSVYGSYGIGAGLG